MKNRNGSEGPFSLLTSMKLKKLQKKDEKLKSGGFFLLLLLALERHILVRIVLERTGKSYVNLCLQIGIWELLLARHTNKLYSVTLSCLFHCVYLAITKATLVTLKQASIFLLIFSLKLPCMWPFHAACRNCWTGESIYLWNRAASFLVRLLMEGIDFIVRAK